MAVSDGIAEAAEDLFVHVRWMSGLHRERLGGVELCLLPGAGPVVAKVGRVRLRSDELDEALDGVPARLRSEGRTMSMWSLGPRTTSSGVGQRLLGLGLVPFASTTAMVATAAPVGEAVGVEVRPVRSETDADSAAAIIAVTFGMGADDEASRFRSCETRTPDGAPRAPAPSPTPSEARETFPHAGHWRVRSLGGVRERRGRLTADDRGGLVNQFVVVESLHHEKGEVDAARDVALENRITHMAAPHG